jgi:hypothetical protein
VAITFQVIGAGSQRHYTDMAAAHAIYDAQPSGDLYLVYWFTDAPPAGRDTTTELLATKGRQEFT